MKSGFLQKALGIGLAVTLGFSTFAASVAADDTLPADSTAISAEDAESAEDIAEAGSWTDETAGEGGTAVDVDDDFIVLHPGEKQNIKVTVTNGPEKYSVRFVSTDGSVAQVLNKTNDLTAYREGVADLTAQVYTTSGSWFNPTVTVHAEKSLKVTVVPVKAADERVKMGIQMFNFLMSGVTGDEGILKLRQLASMGYDGVEWFSGNFDINNGTVMGIPYAEMKSMMDELGLESAGLHYNSGMLNGASDTEVGTINEDTVSKIVDACKAMDIKLVWSQCSYPMRAQTPLDLTDYTPAQIDEILKITQQQFALERAYFAPAGVQLMYHNHSEFYKASDGSYGVSNIGYDVQQIDYYWLTKAMAKEYGRDQAQEKALAYLNERADKVATIHIKDGTTDPEVSNDYTSWGQGELDIQSVLDVARTHDNIKWVIVENDGATSVNGGAIQDARISKTYADSSLNFKREKKAAASAMYRVYNPNSGEHFYTADTAERDNLISLGWKDESTAWYAPETSGTPVYRLYNPNAGEHHYTTSADERDSLVKAGWKDEGTGWYSDDAKGVTIYRLYNPNEYANNHHYTADAAEKDNLVSLGWKYEGECWYGVAE